MYDNSLGRWHGVDKLSETHFSSSTYTYVLNNPLIYIDYLGLDDIPFRKVHWPTFDPNNDVIVLDEIIVTSESNNKGNSFYPVFGGIGRFNIYTDDFYHTLLRQLSYDPSDWRRGMERIQQTIDALDIHIALAQIYMDGYNARNHDFSLFLNPRYVTLNKWAKITGKISNALTFISFSSDLIEYETGRLSPSRFWYRTGSTGLSLGASVAVGSFCGGPMGAVAGFIVGGTTMSGEIMYDEGKELHDAGFQYWSNFFQNLATGKYMFGW